MCAEYDMDIVNYQNCQCRLERYESSWCDVSANQHPGTRASRKWARGSASCSCRLFRGHVLPKSDSEATNDFDPSGERSVIGTQLIVLRVAYQHGRQVPCPQMVFVPRIAV